jgi:hypothetical protein
MMGRVSPSHPYNAGRAGLGVGGLDGMCTLHSVVVLCFWCRHRTIKFREVSSKGQLSVLLYCEFGLYDQISSVIYWCIIG